MKKTFLIPALLMGTTLTATAQTLLDEDFEKCPNEQYSRDFPEGWTTKDSYNAAQYGVNAKIYYNWAVNYIEKGVTTGGTHCAIVDAPTWTGSTGGGLGPREEWLITPELNLDNTYQLSFDFEAAAAYVFEYKQYDFEVRVIDGDNVTTIFNCANADDCKAAGIPGSTYYAYRGDLWDAWTSTNAKLDLSAFQGKKVKVAFVYRMLTTTANVLYIDNVSVKQFTPSVGPEPQVDNNRYVFAPQYVGEKFYSEVFTLKNVGLDGLQVTAVEAPQGFGSNVNLETVLDRGQSMTFQVYYEASLTSAVEGNVVLKTTGGDVTIAVKATKVALPDGYTLENFEGAFPPAGWNNNGAGQTTLAIEGDQSAYFSGALSAQYLYGPRLDFSDTSAEHKLYFTYYANYYDEDESYYPSNDLVVQVSADGGKTWTTKYTSDYTVINELVNAEVNLDDESTKGNDNVLFRFYCTAISYDANEGADPYATYIFDRVLMPSVYGLDGVPMAAEYTAPADKATDVYNRSVTFGWRPAQFAEGYKIYIGTNDAANDVVDGEDLGDALSYTAKNLKTGTTYRWKVIPYNSVGAAADVPVWSFSTVADMTVTEYPYFEGFEGETFPPLGWNVERSGYTYWSTNGINPFDGKKSISALGRSAGDSTIITSMDLQLPATPMQLSFYWGNDMCVSLLKDNTGQKHNPSVYPGTGYDETWLEILADGEWTRAAYLSDPGEVVDDETVHYWFREVVDLTPYAGKTIALRWVHRMFNYNRSEGVSLDNITIKASDKMNAAFNMAEWNAGRVNYMDEVSTDDKVFALVNDCGQDMTVESVAFNTQNFTSTIQSGDVLKAGESQLFNMTFKALDAAAQVEDQLTVSFVGGYSVSLPVRGNALAKDMLMKNFEKDASLEQPSWFLCVDNDRAATYNWGGYWVNALNLTANTRLSFLVSSEEDWYNIPKSPEGKNILFAMGTETTSDDWLISDTILATPQTTFEFDYRTWESVNSIMPSGTPVIYVKVSTKSRNTLTDFEQVEELRPDYYDDKNWMHASIDLSRYAGQPIFVAIEHRMSGYATFFDNLLFAHVGDISTGIRTLDNEQLTIDNVYDLSGRRVNAQALKTGIYVRNGKKFVVK